MIYPAIDLMDGGCVRLFKGDFNQRTDYDVSPLDVAKSYAAAGAEWMHIVDLDGAKQGKTEQADLIMEIASKSGLKVQTGGGLRDLAQIQRLLKGGADGEPSPATHGWAEAGDRTLWHVLDDYMGTGLKTILVTDIGRDGVEGGSNVELYKKIMTNYPTLNLITSGGVGTLGHVSELKALKPHGVIIGKALYEERFTLEEAIAC